MAVDVAVMDAGAGVKVNALKRGEGGFEQSRSRGEGTHMWFRTPNGEITMHTASKYDLVDRQEEGWVPLKRYGLFKYQVWHASHPFETLFMRGGAKEFSVAQIVANGWHLNPPLVPTCGIQVGVPGHPSDAMPWGDPRRSTHTGLCFEDAEPVAFPQLAGLDLPGEQECKYCGRTDLPTPQALANHVSVMHADMVGHEHQANALVKGLAPLLQGQTGQMGAEAGAEAMPAAEMFEAFQRWLTEQTTTAGAALPPRREPDAFDVTRRYDPGAEPELTVTVPWPATTAVPDGPPAFAYICGFCGEGFNNSRLFLGHVKKCKAGPADEETDDPADQEADDDAR